MVERSSSDGSVLDVLGHALVFASGALVAGYAALTAWSSAYMRANPSTGGVSGGSSLLVAGLFLVGVFGMFLAANAALERLLETTA